MEVLDETIQRIKQAGFSHIKVEFEADLGRCNDYDSCDYCGGNGRSNCDSCEGEGFLDTGETTRVSGDTVYSECDDCYGEGTQNCYECDGEGNVNSGFSNEDDCAEYMISHVGPEVASHLTYSKFYEDGSVDSEFTFTIPVEYAKDVIAWSNAFKALGDECGQLDISGAGLHIAVIPSESNGYYPVNRNTLNYDGVMNFTNQVTKLLPALFFLASADRHSRPLGYRMPQIAEEKYSAVSHHDSSCFEFRVFETCYDRPEAFFDYLETIANCLKFYADPTLTVESIGQTFGFEEHGYLLSRFYSTPEQLRILNATVKHLKPKAKSFKKLKEERGIDFTIKSLQDTQKERVSRIKKEYYEYKKRWLSMFHSDLTEQEMVLFERYRNDGRDEEESRRLARNITRLENIDSFVRNNLSTTHRQSRIRV